ncbi:MAG: AzlD domain-containing protein [Lachnospiraceae bacterium]|nr:AzlD domain-containing protein [Lachnospiraceae bacterium]
MNVNIWLYLIAAALTIYAIRAVPMTLLRKELKSPFLRSFLYYVPYVTLSVMTFPAILSATGDVRSAAAGFIAAVALAFFDGNLFRVACGACIAVYLFEMIL